jgi:hypothetical protein
MKQYKHDLEFYTTDLWAIIQNIFLYSIRRIFVENKTCPTWYEWIQLITTLAIANTRWINKQLIAQKHRENRKAGDDFVSMNNIVQFGYEYSNCRLSKNRKVNNNLIHRILNKLRILFPLLKLQFIIYLEIVGIIFLLI